jgi:hypothetical protein
LFDHVQDGLQAGGSLWLRDRMHRRLLALAVVKRDLPLGMLDGARRSDEAVHSRNCDDEADV